MELEIVPVLDRNAVAEYMAWGRVDISEAAGARTVVGRLSTKGMGPRTESWETWQFKW